MGVKTLTYPRYQDDDTIEMMEYASVGVANRQTRTSAAHITVRCGDLTAQDNRRCQRWSVDHQRNYIETTLAERGVKGAERMGIHFDLWFCMPDFS